MEEALKGGKEVCINLTTFGGGSIMDWTPNITKDQDPLTVQPYSYFPEIFFYQWNDTHYQWCGPMILIAQYFSRFMNIRLKIMPPQSIEAYQKRALEGELDPCDIGLLASLYSHYDNFAVKKGLDGIVGISQFVDYLVPGRVLAVTHRGEDSLFKQFECLEWEVYYGIIASLIVISTIMGFYNQSVKSFVSTFWSYSSVILSDYYSIPMNTTLERQLTGVWLMVCTVLLAAFSGQLREQVIKIRPIYWIDSWDDLHAEEWRHLNITTYFDTSIISYMNNFPNKTMARDFQQRTVALHISIGKDADKDFDYEDIKQGKYALVMDGLQLHKLKRNVVSNDFREDIDFHVSEIGALPQPFFNLFNKLTMDDSMFGKWNKVITMLRENGVYDDFKKRAMNPNKTDLDYTQKPSVDSYKFEEIFLFQLKGIIILLLISLLISFIIFLIEIFINGRDLYQGHII